MLNKMDNQRVNNAKSGPVLYLVRDQACQGGTLLFISTTGSH